MTGACVDGGRLVAGEPGRVDVLRTSGDRFRSFQDGLARGALLDTGDTDGAGDADGSDDMDDIADGAVRAPSSFGPPS